MAIHSSDDFSVLDIISTKGKKHKVRLLRAQIHKPLYDGRTEVCVKTFTSKKYEIIRDALCEAQTLMSASTKHQSICKMYDCFTEKKGECEYTFGIVMEYFPRGDLEDEIKHRKRHQEHWPEDTLMQLFEQLVQALETLQREKICHRDIKPQNIFTASKSRLKIGDFGVSMRELTESSSNHTLVGTPIYFSPLCAQAFLSGEILHKGNVGVRHDMYKSDVFSLGLTFLRMASLRTIRGLNAGDQGNIDGRIGEVGYSPRMQLFLRTMLSIDEGSRPDFIELSQYLQTVYQCSLEHPLPVSLPETDSISRVNAQVQELQSALERYSQSPNVSFSVKETDQLRDTFQSDFSTMCEQQYPQTAIQTVFSSETEKRDPRPGVDFCNRDGAILGESNEKCIVGKCASMCFGNILVRIGNMCGKVASVPASALS